MKMKDNNIKSNKKIKNRELASMAMFNEWHLYMLKI